LPYYLSDKRNTLIEQKTVGALLGDGWLELKKKSPSSNTRFRFEQSLKHSQRFYNLYNYFALMCASNVRLQIENVLTKLLENLKFKFQVRSILLFILVLDLYHFLICIINCFM